MAEGEVQTRGQWVASKGGREKIRPERRDGPPVAGLGSVERPADERERLLVERVRFQAIQDQEEDLLRKGINQVAPVFLRHHRGRNGVSDPEPLCGSGVGARAWVAGRGEEIEGHGREAIAAADPPEKIAALRHGNRRQGPLHQSRLLPGIELGGQQWREEAEKARGERGRRSRPKENGGLLRGRRREDRNYPKAPVSARPEEQWSNVNIIPV